MDTQQAYEAIRAHFDTPGAQLAKVSSGGGATCQYRTANGQKCAVGALIPDGMYDPQMECGLVDDLLNEFEIVRGYLYDVDVSFLKKAQSLHDSHASDAQTFVTMLDLLASASGLRADRRAFAYTPVAA